MIPIALKLWKYRKLAGYALAAVALALLAWRINAWRGAYTELPVVKESLTAERKARAVDAQAWKAQLSEYAARVAKQEADSAVLAKTLADEQTQIERLKEALSRAKLVTYAPSVQNCPPVPRLSSAFRMCVQAASTGTAADAARCETFGVRQPEAP